MRRIPFSGSENRAGTPSQAGLAAVTGYFVILYLVPWLGYQVFPDELSSLAVFQILPIRLYTILIVPAVFGLFWVLYQHMFRSSLRPRGVPASRFLAPLFSAYERHRLPIAVAALVPSVMYYREGLNSFRYSSIGISGSDSAPLIIFVAVLNTAICADLFHVLLMAPVATTLRRRAENLLLAVSCLLSANGVLFIFVGLLVLGATAFPRFFRTLLFSPPDSTWLRALGRTAASGVLTLAIFVASWLAGEGIKALSNTKAENTILGSAQSTAQGLAAGEAVVKDYAFYLLERTSVYYYSLLYTTNGLSEVNAVAGGSPLLLPLRTLLFRADYILGSHWRIEKPEVSSIGRLNYLLVIKNEKRFPRAGATPGVIAAFTYALPFPLNVIVCAIYLAWFAAMIDVLTWRRGSHKVSLLGVLLLYMLGEQFLQSPIDLLLVFDPTVMFAVITFGFYRTERRNRAVYLAEAAGYFENARRTYRRGRMPVGTSGQPRPRLLLPGTPGANHAPVTGGLTS